MILDPINADDYPSLQAAVDAAAGRTLRLGPGYYTLAEVVATKPFHLEGAGPRFTHVAIAPGAAFGLRFDCPQLRYTRVSGFSLNPGPGFTGACLSFPYGLQSGRLEDLEIIGTGTGTGIELRGAHPNGLANNNQYATEIRGCLFGGLTLGILLQGQMQPGALPNQNDIIRCTFNPNLCHISIQQGEMNNIKRCIFNAVTAATAPRVVISGRYSTTLFRANYWDVIGDQLCVRQQGFGKDVKRRALCVDGDNQPAAKFSTDGQLYYAGIYA